MTEDRFPSRRLAAAAVGMALLLTLCQSCGSRPSDPPLPGARTVAAHAPTAMPAARADQHEAKMLADALKKRPDHVPVLLRLAALAMESGKPAEAEKYLKDVLAQDPGNIPARLDLGKIQFEEGHVPEAIQTTAEILKTQPDNADALYNLGAIYGNVGQRDRAIDYWSRLLASSPQSESGQRARRMMAELQRSMP